MASSTRAESRLRGKLVCSKCYREFDRSHILWCGQCNHDLVCYTCGDQHVAATEHEVGGLCHIHEQLLNRYCKTCRRLICDVCESSRHSGQGHDVVEYKVAIAETMSELDNHVDETGKTQFSALVEQIAQVSEFREEVETKKMQLCDVIKEVYGTDSGLIETEIMKMKEKIGDYQQQIEQFTQDCRARIEQLRQDIEDAERRKRKTELEFKKKKILLDQLEEDFGRNLENIDTALTEMKATEDYMRTLLGRATLMAKEKLLAPKILEDIKRTRSELDELVVAAEQDRITQLREMVRKAPGCCFTEDYVRAAGRFRSAALADEIDLKVERFAVFGVVLMSESHLAICGGTYHDRNNSIVPPWKLMLVDIQSEEQTIILDGDTPLFDLKKINHDELVVLCRKKPFSLRIINFYTRAIRDINVNLAGSLDINLLLQFEVDGRGRYILLYGKLPNMHLVLINSEGTVLHDIEVGDVGAFTLSRLTNTVFTRDFKSSKITTYHLNENGFTKVASVDQDVEGPQCHDICSGVLGDVYGVGYITGSEVREATPATPQLKIYQLELGEDNRVTRLRPLEDFTLPPAIGFRVAQCSVFTNKLAISCDDRVNVFTLKP